MKLTRSLSCLFLLCSTLSAMETTPNIDFQQLTESFDRELNLFAHTQSQLPFLGTQQPFGWTSYDNLDQANQDPKEQTYKCLPFVQGQVFPPGKKIILFGDIHGNYEALDWALSFINQNPEIAPNPHYLFLGDYINRSRQFWDASDDTLVYNRLLALYNQNPQCVTLLRGNHEDIRALYRFDAFRENPSIFDAQPTMRFKIATSYEFLPAAFFVGCHDQETAQTGFIQFCHGGIEPNFNPQPFLSNIPLNSSAVCSFLPMHPSKNTWDSRLGLLWNSFCQSEEDTPDRVHGSINFGKQHTTTYLTNAASPNTTLYGIFGAHQHYHEVLKEMKFNSGLACMHGGIVHILTSAHNDLPCYSFCVITVTEHPKDWHLEVYSHLKGRDKPGQFIMTRCRPLFCQPICARTMPIFPPPIDHSEAPNPPPSYPCA